MSFVKDAIELARGKKEQTGIDGRAYIPGAAGIPAGYIPFGADSSEYAPEIYGEYISKSNPVYAVVSQRAAYLGSLPMKLFKFSPDQSSLHIPRTEETEEHILKRILEQLKDVEDGNMRAVSSPFVKNVIGSWMGARSRLELKTLQRKMGMIEVDEGPVAELLRHVNPFWTQTRLLRMTMMAKDIWGQAYWFVERGESGRGTPKEIWWAKPTQVTPLPHESGYIEGYWYEPLSGGEPLFFRPSEVIRIYNPNPNDEFQPLSPLSAARIYADHENTSMQANMNLHKRGLHPGAIVTPVNRIVWETDQAREIEDRINRRLGGYDKAHRWGVFRQEVKLHQTAVTPKDSEFLSGMGYDIERVANAYAWPIDLLGGKRTYENIDQALKQAWQTIVIEAAFIADEVSEQLFPMFGKDSDVDIVFFDHTGIAVLQESETARWEREKSQVDIVFTRNEWRREQGLEPVDGGDRLFVSNQHTPLDSPVFVTGHGEETVDENDEVVPVEETA